MVANVGWRPRPRQPWCPGRGYVEAIGGDYVAVQLLSLDNVDLAELIAAPVRHADGRNNNWMEQPAEIRHL